MIRDLVAEAEARLVGYPDILYMAIRIALEKSMPFHVRDRETDGLVRELAEKYGIGLTEAVKLAVRRELQREPLPARLAALRAEVLKRRATGLRADKAFFDDLSGEA